MAILEEMRILVDDLGAAFKFRVEGEQERQATALRDAHARVQGVRDRVQDARDLHAAAAEDARLRLEEMSRRSAEVADMLEGFFRDRMEQSARAASDRVEFEHARLKAEHERRAEAAEAARARIAEIRELGALWHAHTAAHGAGMPGRQALSAAPRPPRMVAPAVARPMAPSVLPVPWAPRAPESDNTDK